MAKYKRLVAGFTGTFTLFAAPFIGSNLIAHAKGSDSAASVSVSTKSIGTPTNEPQSDQAPTASVQTDSDLNSSATDSSGSSMRVNASNNSDGNTTVTINGETTVLPSNTSMQQDVPATSDNTNSGSINVSVQSSTNNGDDGSSHSSVRVRSRNSSQVNVSTNQSGGSSMQ